jgi:hypothetical protein
MNPKQVYLGITALIDEIEDISILEESTIEDGEIV